MNYSSQLSISGQVKNEYGIFLFHTTEDAMVGVFSCPKVLKSVPPPVLQQILQTLKVQHGIHHDVLEEVSQSLARGETVDKVEIAQGTQPLAGEDGMLAFAMQDAPAEFDPDEAKVDFRENPTIRNVCAGEVIATLHPPVHGKAGKDVYGRVVAPSVGRTVNVQPGKQVVFHPQSHTFRAEVDGRVVATRTKISVDPIFHVEGDLDLSIGNVRFVGFVRIDGDVPDEFVVEGEKGVWVGGSVGASRISTKGSVEIVGGMAGKGRGEIHAEGEVRVHYLNDVLVESNGDVTVTKEVLNSRLFTLGRANLATATVVGGEVVALRGILVLTAGSQLDIPTWLISGIDYHVRDELVELNKWLTKTDRRQQELLNRAGPMIKRAKGILPSAAVREEIDDLMQTIRQLERDLAEARQRAVALSEGYEDIAVDCISVSDRIYIGVKMTVGRVEGMSVARKNGPLSMVPDTEGTTIDTVEGLLVKKLWVDNQASEHGQAEVDI